MAEVEILLKGYCRSMSRTSCRASSTVVLIRDQGKNILVDTGNFQDEKKIISALKKRELKPANIDIVVLTHFHPDHIGCNHLFRKSHFIVSRALFQNDKFYQAPSSQSLSKNLKLISTSGHSEDSATLLVRTAKGVVACAGDLFWFKGDERAKLVERECSNRKLFHQNRRRILKIADYIIPGHGGIYKVK